MEKVQISIQDTVFAEPKMADFGGTSRFNYFLLLEHEFTTKFSYNIVHKVFDDFEIPYQLSYECTERPRGGDT